MQPVQLSSFVMGIKSTMRINFCDMLDNEFGLDIYRRITDQVLRKLSSYKNSATSILLG